MHLDSFQRVNADPASISVIHYTQLRPFVLHVNHTGARLSAALRAAAKPPEQPQGDLKDEQRTPEQGPDGEVPSGDAVVGGSTD
jgi:hypothetical protein